ncbi:AAA family ATPase [Pelagibacterium lacus]|uniref:CtpF protein n=1 Tax=Pelagibacterium lacus TaxID=2282655 RepID=A0A369W7K8_9HYPH|nr:AAA family ATPase [Pelagibacterium lacus]RDE10017.1 CtpF protein [Pelagibacterium lacus]
MTFIETDAPQTDIEAPGDAVTGARLIPRITIQAFCEHSQTAQIIEDTTHDRRMSKVALTTHNGGLEGAVETYRTNPTPNLIIVETTLPADRIEAALQRLADVCDASTRVVVIGHANDVMLYRSLIRAGVSEYLVMPATSATIINAISDLFASEGAGRIGRSIAFIGAKGGAGSSTLSHNVAWSIAKSLRQDVLVVDLDLPFGTVGLDFNQDPPQGIADAVYANDKMDAVMLDRLMSKAANHINLLAAPASLDRTYDLNESSFEQIIELSQKQVPIVILDIPHLWTGWVRRTLAAVDEIVIVAEPDLANLRNAKALADTIKAMRPSENDPVLLVNKTGIAKRPEIPAGEFASSIECRLAGQIAFEPALFGTAANNGQMIAEVSATHKVNDIFRSLGLQLTGRQTVEAGGRAGSINLPGLLRKLKRA